MGKANKIVMMSIAMAVVLTLVTACSKGGSSTGGKQDSGTATPAVTTAAKDTSGSTAPITVEASWMYDWWKPKEWGKDPVTKVITEKTGVQFHFNAVSGDGNEKASIMLLAKDYPEVMWMDRGPVLDKYIAAGALYSIDELTQKYNFPDIIGNYIPQKAMDALKKPDGHVYGIPNWFNEKGEFGVGGGVSVRNDIYTKLGTPKIDTIDDLTKYLKQVRDSNLKVQGQNVYAIGFQGVTGNVERLSNLWGSKNSSSRYYDESDKKVKYFLRNETTLNALKWMNMLYKEKLMDPENFTYKSQQSDEAYAKGKFAVLIANFWDLWKPNEILKAANPQMFYKVIPAPAGTSGVKPNMDGYDTTGWNVAVITKNAKDPEKIMKYFNYYLSPEGQTLSFYGIEGQTWEKTADGKPMLKPGVYEAVQKDAEGYGKKTGIRYLDLNQNQKYNWERESEAPDRRADRKLVEAVNFDATWLKILNLSGESKEGIIFANISTSLETDLTKIIMSANETDVVTKYNDLIKNYEKQGLLSVEDAWTKMYAGNK